MRPEPLGQLVAKRQAPLYSIIYPPHAAKLAFLQKRPLEVTYSRWWSTPLRPIPSEQATSRNTSVTCGVVLLLLRILQFPEKNIHYSFEVDLWPARRVNRGFSHYFWVEARNRGCENTRCTQGLCSHALTRDFVKHICNVLGVECH